MNDRYSDDRFRDIYRRVRGVDTIDQHALGTLLSMTRASDASIDGAPRADLAMPIRIELTSSRICDVGQVLIDLDLEIRRAASFLSSGSTRPLRERSSLTLLGAHSTTMFVMVAGSVYDMLRETPLDLVLATSWFWDHRLNQTKYRALVSNEESLDSLRHVTRSAEIALAASRASVVTLRPGSLGGTMFEFQPDF